jgi:hypothetical protein
MGPSESGRFEDTGIKERRVRRVTLMILAVALVTEAGWAQRKPMVPMAAVSASGKLSGKTKVLYLLRQLDLTQEQREHARGLIATIIDTGAEQDLSLEQVYTLMAAMQQAEADGDEERKQELTQQLRELGKGSDSNEEFFTNMASVLTDEQKLKLKRARERLERTPSGGLRPVDVFRAVRALDLNEEQQEHVRGLQDKLRQAMRGVQNIKDKQRFQLMNGLLDGIASKLTPEQQEQFELSIAKLRPDLAYRLRVLTEGREETFQERKEGQAEAAEEADPDDD